MNLEGRHSTPILTSPRKKLLNIQKIAASALPRRRRSDGAHGGELGCRDGQDAEVSEPELSALAFSISFQMTRSSGKSVHRGKPRIGSSETYDAGCGFAVPKTPDCACFVGRAHPQAGKSVFVYLYKLIS